MKVAYHTIGRLCFHACLPLVRVWFSKRKSRRVRIVVTNSSNEVLLVKSWFSHQRWSLPGGGIRRGESEKAAASRELYEETSIKIPPNKLTFISDIEADAETTFTAVVFKASMNNSELETLKGFYKYEIIDRKWFKLTNLPNNRSRLIDKLRLETDL